MSAAGRGSDLDRVVETILVDAYGDDEQYAAFLTVFAEETRLLALAALLGVPVTVTGFDYTSPARGLVAICRSPREPARSASSTSRSRRTP